ncbi:putative nucleotide-diphospho-sugar transferase [Thiomicrorhabdus sp. 6S3-12]|uniref:putative nucleotide-diphospho-sugar transferase n=1 Tax=Thiomicrorhabdus sp. 6S3-12 TaxID=2819681 RepID=UPI001AADD96E|nr:hypothetical protein [Thiomicrorhabdus sp. 6S3-12]
MLKVVGFYTDDPLYSEHAKLFKASLERFGIEPYLQKYSQDEWQNIIALKPSFIKGVMDEFDCPVLYVDVDAFVHEDITPFFSAIEEDVAFHLFKGEELLSGTLFFNNSERAKQLINYWLKEQSEHPDDWDQKTLQRAVERMKKDAGLSIYLLGEEYTQIFDSSTKEGKTVIEHLQASRDRRFEKVINRKNVVERFFKLIPIFNVSYRKILKRRKYVEELANSVGLTLKFESFR